MRAPDSDVNFFVEIPHRVRTLRLPGPRLGLEPIRKGHFMSRITVLGGTGYAGSAVVGEAVPGAIR